MAKNKMTALERCDLEILACERGDYGEARLIDYMLGYADWQIEKQLIIAEQNESGNVQVGNG